MVLDYWQGNGRFWGTWSNNEIEGPIIRIVESKIGK